MPPENPNHTVAHRLSNQLFVLISSYSLQIHFFCRFLADHLSDLQSSCYFSSFGGNSHLEHQFPFQFSTAYHFLYFYLFEPNPSLFSFLSFLPLFLLSLSLSLPLFVSFLPSFSHPKLLDQYHSIPSPPLNIFSTLKF